MQKKVAIKNRFRLKLAAVAEAPDFDNKHPFVLLLHGFKGYKDEETYVTLAQELLKVNIGSIRFDASGFAESDGTIEEDYRFGNYVEDVESIYSWLLGQDFVEKEKIGVCGQSMGGMQAIVFVSKHPEIRSLCVVSSPEKMATTDLLHKELEGWRERGYLEMDSSRYSHKVKFPYAFIEEAMKWDMRDYIKNVKCHSLYMWGNADVTVRPEQTKLLFKLANEPKERVEIKDMNHFYKKDPVVLTKVNIVITDFFKNNL